MIADTYAGDSPSKKIARVMFWHDVRVHTGADFTARRYLVLASREMGDFLTLRAMGVPAGNIVCVERNIDAAAAARAKCPDANVIVNDVARVVGRDFDVVFLDFCSPVCRETLSLVALTAASIPSGSLLGVGVLKGREQDFSGHTPSRKMRRAAASARQRTLAHDHGVSPSVMAISCGFANQRSAISSDAEMSRVDLGLARACAVTAWCTGTVRTLLSVVNYNGSSPMTLSLHKVDRYRRVAGLSTQQSRDFLDRQSAEVERDQLRIHNLGTLTTEDVRDAALACRNADASLMYNIPRSTLAAWRAHATRGTYGEAAE